MAKESKYKYKIETDKEPTNFIIYKAVSPSDKIYIGITSKKSIKRIAAHYTASLKPKNQYPFARSIRKYGIENIKWFIIDYANSPEEMKELEKYWIQKLNTYVYNKNNNGYNITIGGDGNHGYIFTDKDKKLMSELKKLYFEERPEEKEKLCSMGKEYMSDSANREKHSEIMKDYYTEHPEKKNSLKMEEIHKENPEWSKSISERQKIHFSDLTNREEQSRKMNEFYEQHPEMRTHISDSLKEYYKNESHREQASISKGAKPFNVYNKDTFEFVGQFINKSICAEKLNVIKPNINKCLKGERKYNKGYLFYYPENDPFLNQELSNSQQDSSFLIVK